MYKAKRTKIHKTANSFAKKRKDKSDTNITQAKAYELIAPMPHNSNGMKNVPKAEKADICNKKTENTQAKQLISASTRFISEEKPKNSAKPPTPIKKARQSNNNVEFSDFLKTADFAVKTLFIYYLNALKQQRK